ncbi:hypothetical protein GQ42DRAFT_109081, partial [Ramicandelaber brevisporus]
WDERQVSQWLRECGFSQFERSFFDNNVCGIVLLELQYTMLGLLGVKRVGDKVRLNAAIKELRQQC